MKPVYLFWRVDIIGGGKIWIKLNWMKEYMVASLNHIFWDLFLKSSLFPTNLKIVTTRDYVAGLLDRNFSDRYKAFLLLCKHRKMFWLRTYQETTQCQGRSPSTVIISARRIKLWDWFLTEACLVQVALPYSMAWHYQSVWMQPPL